MINVGIPGLGYNRVLGSNSNGIRSNELKLKHRLPKPRVVALHITITA